jgi:hypothetical protein
MLPAWLLRDGLHQQDEAEGKLQTEWPGLGAASVRLAAMLPSSLHFRKATESNCQGWLWCHPEQMSTGSSLCVSLLRCRGKGHHHLQEAPGLPDARQPTLFLHVIYRSKYKP